MTTGTTTYYEYYPMWVEPINVVRYGHVEYTVKINLMTTLPNASVRQLKEISVPAQRWRPQPPPVELRRVRHQTRPVSIEIDNQRSVRPVITRPLRP